MTLGTLIFGTETRTRPLLSAFLAVTALRIGWDTINADGPDILFGLYSALSPWPIPVYSWIVWATDLALLLYQARALLRLARSLLVRFTPNWATFLGLDMPLGGINQHLTPRHRSWWPTAFQFCTLLILSCCAIAWIGLMFSYHEWIPFADFMASSYANVPLLVGLFLAFLGFTFGGTYIARASGDVSARFGVTPLPDDHWLTQRVHNLAEQLNLPKPAVGITSVMNAFAMGTNPKTAMVVIGTPLFAFEKDELDAIVGHELGHILHHDVARMQFAEGFQQMLVKVVNALTIIGMILAASAAKTRSSARLNVQLANASGQLLRSTLFVSSELAAKGISRNREYHADAVGAHVTSAEAMARALKRVHGIATQPTAEERHYGYLMFRGAGFGRLFATHPTLEARLRALDVNSLSDKSSQAALDLATVAALESGEGLGLAGKPASRPGLPSPVEAKATAMTQAIAKRTAILRTKAGLRRVLIVVATCIALVIVIPAIVGFYGLDRRLGSVTSSVGAAASGSWQWTVATAESWLGIAQQRERARQLETREQAVQAAEARLSAERDAFARVAAQKRESDNTALANVIRERDILQSRLNTLYQQLRVANARATQANPASRPDPAVSQLQASVDQLQRQLSALNVDRSQLNARISEQETLIASLRSQLAATGTASTPSDTLAARIDQQQALITSLNQDVATWKAKAAQSQQDPAPDPASWLAAAVDRGGVVQTITGQVSQEAAEKIAIKLCGGSANGCRLIGSYANACFTLSRPSGQRVMSGNWWYAADKTWQDSERRGLNECQQGSGAACDVRFTACSPSRLAKPQ